MNEDYCLFYIFVGSCFCDGVVHMTVMKTCEYSQFRSPGWPCEEVFVGVHWGWETHGVGIRAHWGVGTTPSWVGSGWRAGLSHVDPSFVHSPLSRGGWGLLGTGFGAGGREPGRGHLGLGGAGAVCLSLPQEGRGPPPGLAGCP
ncbi:hypothetical protein ILYODFUR_034236 [Ilyodon furcidens]|uniref:Uncharacterized protein n=1 Tax=Ilyodon furcidens TaxID=33524 RepID=A0ABV0VKX9_9TELE